jgi:hypothetical protein
LSLSNKYFSIALEINPKTKWLRDLSKEHWPEINPRTKWYDIAAFDIKSKENVN